MLLPSRPSPSLRWKDGLAPNGSRSGKLIKAPLSSIFRPSQPSDAGAISELLAETGLSLHAGQALTALGENSAGIQIAVVQSNQELIGVLQYRIVADEAEILDLAIAGLHRRKGNGNFLLSSFIELAAKSGVKNVFLEVRESNRAAIALYQAVGFAECGRRLSYYRNPDETAILMNLKLAG